MAENLDAPMPQAISAGKRQKILEQYDRWEDLRRPFQPVQSQRVGLHNQDRTLSRLLNLVEFRDPSCPLPITSHRPIWGPTIVRIKTFIQRLANPFILLCIGRQLRFNDRVIALGDSLILMEERINELEQRLAVWETSNVGAATERSERIDR